jgi:hypothetical protein
MVDRRPPLRMKTCACEVRETTPQGDGRCANGDETPTDKLTRLTSDESPNGAASPWSKLFFDGSFGRSSVSSVNDPPTGILTRALFVFPTPTMGIAMSLPFASAKNSCGNSHWPTASGSHTVALVQQIGVCAEEKPF